MSVLIKRTDSSSGGGSSKGYPPGNVTNVTIKGEYKKVTIKWTDPDDVVVGDKTLSTWQSTTLVRKKGSIPTSIKDGDTVLETTEKNKYKNTEYSDNNLEIGTYYYRFFVCNTDKIYNNDSSMIYSAIVVLVDPILKNNTWDQIASASESGYIPSTWNIGDEIDLTLSGSFNETVTLQIWDFNHFDKSDGSGKAGICFGMKNLMEDKQYMNYAGGHSGGWNNSDMRNTTMQNVYNSMPTDLQNVIKEVNTYANDGNETGNSSIGLLCTDKVFLPGLTEIDDSWGTQNLTERNQTKFPIFTNDSSRIKKLSNGSGNANYWWTRSPFSSSNGAFCYVQSDGKTNGNILAGEKYRTLGVCFCFNV